MTWLALNLDSSISTSCVAGIRDMHHHTWCTFWDWVLVPFLFFPHLSWIQIAILPSLPPR
jgi:hypothetical protein